jgi:hypothetical protein
VGNLCVELLSSTFPMRGFLVNDGMISRYN